MKYEFIVEVEIDDLEKDGFMYAFENKKFDFFRYLADNGADISLVKDLREVKE